MQERAIPGVISPGELYTLSALKWRLGLKDAALRAARRGGLRVLYKHGRGYVLGQDWIQYILEGQGEPSGLAG